MSRFDLSVEDMFSGDFASRVSSEINKFSPGGLKTSRSVRGDRRIMNLTMFNLSEIMMRVPAFESPEAVLGIYESMVAGTIGSFIDQLQDIPGLVNTLPPDIRAKVDLMGLERDEDRAEEGRSQPTEDGVPASAARVVSLARNEIGVTEYPPGSNKQQYAGIAGVANGRAWCATFLMAMFIKAGMSQKGLLNPSTEDSIRRYRNAGQAGSTPRVGALAFFNFRGSNRHVSHVGLVAGWDDSNVTTIDGNTSGRAAGSQDNGGMVAERKRALSSVVEYAYPKYATGGGGGGALVE